MNRDNSDEFYIIEEAGVGDIPSIKDILTFAWRDTYKDVLSDETIIKITTVWHNPEMFRNQIEDTSTHFLVARNTEGEVIGLATMVEVDKSTCMLARLYVRPDYQRRKIGKNLVEGALKYFLNADKIRVEVMSANFKAHKFYSKLGFVEKSRVTENIGNDMVETIIMEKDVDRQV